MATPATPQDSSVPADSPPAGPSRPRRVVEAGAFVAVWVTAGYVLPVSSNGYLLLGIPLTVAFQVVVRRRPLRELFAGATTRFGLDGRGAALAVALAVLPAWLAVTSLQDGDPATTGWYLAATAGAACAAFALRAGGIRSALRAAALPLAIGSSGMALVFGALHLARGVPLPADAAVVALARYAALYFPATFVMEEVAFRGALDAHVHHHGERHGLLSAVYVSALWGIWHLPVSHSLPFALQAAELVAVHIVLGVPLSFAWRSTRNLAGPAFAHAVNDAVRNAVMLGL